MRFLVEKTLNEVDIFAKTQQGWRPKDRSDFDKYRYDEYINNLINSNPNLKPYSKIYLDLIKQVDNDNYLNYLANLKQDVKGEKTIRTIAALIHNGTITGKERWLRLKGLYSESDGANEFKVKALAFVSKKENREDFEGLTKDILFNKDGKLLSARTIKKHLDQVTQNIKQKADDEEKAKQLQQEREKTIKQMIKDDNDRKKKDQEEIDKKGDTGVNILANHLGIEKIDTETIHTYVKELTTGKNDLKLFSDQLIDSGELDDEIEKILKDRYISVIGREPIQLLNNKLQKEITKQTRDSLGG